MLVGDMASAVEEGENAVDIWVSVDVIERCKMVWKLGTCMQLLSCEYL